jgi:prepilin-type N-terminal cleavage/methylation domain-containing protein
LNYNRKTSKNFEAGFTLIELISTLVIISVLAAVLIPRYVDAEQSSKMRALDIGIAEINGRETLTWALVKLSNTGYLNDDQVWAQVLTVAGTDLGADYDWSLEQPTLANKKGTLRFKRDVAASLARNPSDKEAPGKWRR